MADSLDQLRAKASLGHQILAMTGNMGPTTGHVFVRAPGADQFLARCRHDGDWSPTWAQPNSMHLMDFDGKPAEPMADWTPPPERNIAMAIFKARPEVNVVIHAHPMYQVLCSITDVPLKPILGAPYGGGSTQIAMKGISVYQRSALIASLELGRAVSLTMGGDDVLLLRGHGNVVTGTSIEEAVLRAIAIEHLALHCWQVALTRTEPNDLLLADIEEMITPQQAGARESADMNANAVRPEGWNGAWEYYTRLLKEGGLIAGEVLIRNK